MTAVKSMDMESIPYDLNFLAGEPQNSSSVRGDQMDCGTFGDLSDTFLPNEICKGSDLFLFNPSLNTTTTTTTNRDGISGVNPPLLESFAFQDSGFSFDRKLYSSPPPYPDDDFYSIEKYFSEDQVFPNLLNCGNLSPLSSEDVESILDTTSLSDDGDVSLSPVGSPPPSSPEFQVALGCEEVPLVPNSSSPSLFHQFIHSNESDGVQTSDSTLAVSSLGHATITGETSRSSSPCLLVSSLGKEKRTKSYRTKKTPYSWGKGTESIPSPINNDDDDDGLEQPQQQQQQLSKKEKKKLQNKNAATRYRQKMKEEAELRKREEDELLKENRRLKNRVDEIQKEIQYLKNLQKEIGKVRTKS